MYQQNSKTMTNEQKIAAEFEALLQVGKKEAQEKENPLLLFYAFAVYSPVF